MRATFKIVLFARKTVDGKQPVNLRVTYARKSRHFTLNRYCLPEHFDKNKGRFRSGFPEWIKENDVLLAIEKRAADYIRDCERENTPFDFVGFSRAVFTHSENTSGPVVWQWCESISQELYRQGRAGNAKFYHGCANVVKSFAERDTLSSVDSVWLERLESFLRKRGAKGGGISVYLKTLRSACNKAVQSGAMRDTWKPFSGYSFSKLEKSRAKRAITLPEVRAIRDVSLLDPFQRLSRDLFMFSFYCWGMNLADIATLTADNIRELRIEYTRQKTGRVYSVNLSPQAGAILDRYKSKSRYLFPILDDRKYDTPKKVADRRRRFAGRMNKALQSVAVQAGISSEGFTFYVARHTYATALKRGGFSHGLIQDALGHSEIKTTEGYLAGFEKSELDRANQRVLEDLG